MIRVRIVADDVDELHAAARAIGRVLTVTQESRPRPRRSGDGVSLYLNVEMPPIKVDAADKADPINQCGRGQEGCGQYVAPDDAVRVPIVVVGADPFVRWHPTWLGAEQGKLRSNW